MQIQIHCKYDELVDPSKLKDHPKNRNKHGQDQIERLAMLYKHHGIRHPIIVSKLSNCIVVGHGRKLSAILAGVKEMPVVYQDFESSESEYAFIQSDNAIALWADLDVESIKQDIKDFPSDFNVELLGVKDFLLAPIDQNQDEQEAYSKKIDPMIYEPTGPKPRLDEMVDVEKTDQLLSEIKASNLTEQDKAFLTLAANRHTVFNYQKIADYYAHAPKEVQEFMEKSALVIIDFNKSIEYGFTVLSENLAKEYANNEL